MKKAHDREVITTAIGALIQHDGSHHRWSPYARERRVLITSLDDFSRKLLYADLFEQETTWTHIKAAETVMLKRLSENSIFKKFSDFLRTKFSKNRQKRYFRTASYRSIVIVV
jgi:hypothetical protein